MPMPARDLWTKIQKELHGRTDREQLRILRRHLDSWHDSWKGPYADLNLVGFSEPVVKRGPFDRTSGRPMAMRVRHITLD